MASLSSVSAGDLGASSNLNQFQEALNGQGNYPIAVTGVNDASLFALDVRNQDPTNQRAFRVRNSSNETLLQITSQVSISDISASSGSITGSTFSAGQITTSTLSLLAASSNVVQVPSARVWHNATQTLTDATPMVPVFNTERWDNDGLHSTVAASSRMVPSRPGLWSVGACVTISSSPLGYRRLEIQVNSTTVVQHEVGAEGSSATNMVLTAQTDYMLSTSDTVSIRVTQGSGGNLSLTTSPNVGCEMWMSYRGAS